MGCSSSSIEKCEALRLCKERKKFIKEAIDSRYALTAAHLSYLQSLRTIGVALRRYAEAEVLIESSLSTLATEVDKTPSHSSYQSPSLSHNAEIVESPLTNGSPYTPPNNVTSINYMKASRSETVTFKIDPGLSRFGDEESIDFPPPPPPFEIGSTWDFFDPSDEAKRLKFIGENGLREPGGEEVGISMEGVGERWGVGVDGNGNFENFEDAEQTPFDDGKLPKPKPKAGVSPTVFSAGHDAVLEQTSSKRENMEPEKELTVFSAGYDAVLEQTSSKRENMEPEKELCAEREDPSEFITHRAKDFLSSIKDIEHRFFRASESGKEVSRMLEASKIRLRSSETKESPQQVTKVITWHRSVSSQSSSSKNPLNSASKDDVSDSGSDFVDEFCMITGSHSSTLERLYAWERKLYDEVKASESIRKAYDYWCDQLRQQFARDAKVEAIDKTRAVVKDLHSQMRVALHAVDSIAKRIERMRDEELQPQLVELIQGLIRMWKVMLECHHAQYITISLAYHTKCSITGQANKESQRHGIAQLQHDIECFRSSFTDWIHAHRSYVESLNGWLQTCIILPQERSRGRRVFSPRRALAPPIFVLCRDWSDGIKTLPSGEVIDGIKAFVADLHSLVAQQIQEQKSKGSLDSINNGDTQSREDDRSDNSSNLSNIHPSLTKVLDRLTKLAEALRKLYEDVRQGTDAAQVAYANYKTSRV